MGVDTGKIRTGGGLVHFEGNVTGTSQGRGYRVGFFVAFHLLAARHNDLYEDYAGHYHGKDGEKGG